MFWGRLPYHGEAKVRMNGYEAVQLTMRPSVVVVVKVLGKQLADRADNYREFIVMKALVFPWINILWAGCVIMIIGTVMAIRRRVKLG